MAEADRKLSNGAEAGSISRPIRRAIAIGSCRSMANVATLTMDVDENAPLFEGYQLKLNSYDLGVDIELADALERLRFEHPAVRVVLLRSGKPRVFCAGANIRMLAGASHAHKVNFCKFTNETRNAIEDASEFSGQQTICVVTGSCAGGGYELALAADHIILVDDGSSTVSLPELPLLAVLPGTGGLTRVTDKRKVRRDHADVFCTTEEGIKGKRAVEWKLVDEVVPNSKLDETVAARAKEFAAKSDRPAGAKGITLAPLEVKATPQGRETKHVSVEIADRIATVTLRGPDAAPPANATRWWRRARRSGRSLWRASWTTRSSISASTSSTSRRSCSNRRAMPAAVLAYDKFLDANKDHWLAREIRLKWKRVLKRVDLTSRTLVTLIEPGSCFAGHAGGADLRRRPRLHAGRPARWRQPAAAAGRARCRQFRRLSDVERSDAAGDALPR